jgi:hypothetical protein
VGRDSGKIEKLNDKTIKQNQNREDRTMNTLEARINYDRALTDYKFVAGNLGDYLKAEKRVLVARKKYLKAIEATVGYQSSWDYNHYLGSV